METDYLKLEIVKLLLPLFTEPDELLAEAEKYYQWIRATPSDDR